jgi:putative ABC transport system ATP-binding protein
MGLIEVQNLKRTYPGKVPTHALRGVSFSVRDGEFVAIMGKSGSGKSTLLHQLALLDMPTGGSLLIDGKNVLAFSESEKTAFRLTNVGYVFQEYAVLGELTALENVALPLCVQGSVTRREAYRQATEFLERVGMGHRLDHYPSELSGGEQQRVAIARSLINKPRILLADEPCASLDTASSETVLKLLSNLNKTLHQTIVMISHEPEDRKWVDRVVWLKDGVIDRIEK